MRKTQKMQFAYKKAVKLTDEELAKVVGGYVQFAEIDDDDLIDISPDLPDIDVPTFTTPSYSPELAFHTCIKCNAQKKKSATDPSGWEISGGDPLCSHEWN